MAGKEARVNIEVLKLFLLLIKSINFDLLQGS